MLLSFAQFEREIAGERIRDKIAASKRKGMWMGRKRAARLWRQGPQTDHKWDFRRYAELGSVALLRAELDRQSIVSKRREGAGGRLAGGQRFSRGALYLMLQNPIYRGDIIHQDTAYPGQHKAILDPELWRIVEDKLAANRHERSLAVGAEAPSLLAGLIVDADGNRMTPTHATKKAKRYRYYVSASAQKGMRIPAGDIVALVLDRLRDAAPATEQGPAACIETSRIQNDAWYGTGDFHPSAESDHIGPAFPTKIMDRYPAGEVIAGMGHIRHFATHPDWTRRLPRATAAYGSRAGSVKLSKPSEFRP
jgi:site-specific DNA recombinase